MITVRLKNTSTNDAYNYFLNIVLANELALCYVPEEHRDYKMCLAAINNDGYNLADVPEQHRSYDLCLVAVRNEGCALKYVPEKHKSCELCLVALCSFINYIKYIPTIFKPNDLNDVLVYLPKDVKDILNKYIKM